MKVMVTGGSGFLGSHVVEIVRSKGYDTINFDLNPPQNEDKFLQGDLAKLDDLLEATQGIDVVCHLAAVGDVYLAFDKPYLATALNVTGTANLYGSLSAKWS